MVLNCSPREAKPVDCVRLQECLNPSSEPLALHVGGTSGAVEADDELGAPILPRIVANRLSRLAIMSPGFASATTSPGSSAQANSSA